MSTEPRIAVVGLGLIGGSFYKASQRAGYAVDGLHHNEEHDVDKADIVLVCLPPDAIVPWIAAHATIFKPHALVVDICGVKQAIVHQMANVPRHGWLFVGGHPMAGREVSGFANARADLFEGACMILTPTPDVPEAALAKLRDYFSRVGFIQTVLTTPERHDEMIAFTSQLCHVIATAYARDPRVADAIGFSAGSYANMTRIATQDERIWSTLYLSDRDALLTVLDGFMARLGEFRSALESRDEVRLQRLIVEGTCAKKNELVERARGDERV